MWCAASPRSACRRGSITASCRRARRPGSTSSGATTRSTPALGRRLPAYRLGARPRNPRRARPRLMSTSRGAADFILNTGPAGWDDTIEDYAPMLAASRERELPMVCANPDLVVIHGGQAGAVRRRAGGALRGDRRHACAGTASRYRSVYESCFRLLGIDDRTPHPGDRRQPAHRHRRRDRRRNRQPLDRRRRSMPTSSRPAARSISRASPPRQRPRASGRSRSRCACLSW